MEKKYLRYLSNYVAGLVNMASSCSKTMGPSYVDADCFSRENYEDEFANLYNVNKDDKQLIKIKGNNIALFTMQILIINDTQEVILEYTINEKNELNLELILYYDSDKNNKINKN